MTDNRQQPVGDVLSELWRTSDRPQPTTWSESYLALLYTALQLPPRPDEILPFEDFSLETELTAMHADGRGPYAMIDCREKPARLNYWAPGARTVSPEAFEAAWAAFRKRQPEPTPK